MILAASSPVFKAILKRNKHSHPLIYMRGMKSVDMITMVDFLYRGEAYVDQENLDSFLAITEELQLKGLKGTYDDKTLREREVLKKPDQMEPKQKMPHRRIPTKESSSLDEPTTESGNTNALALPTQKYFSGDSQELDETVRSMMETSLNFLPHGKKRERGKICKVCGKEGKGNDIMRHIETNHLEGVSIPCNNCDKIFRSRDGLRCHISKHHRQH